MLEEFRKSMIRKTQPDTEEVEGENGLEYKEIPAPPTYFIFTIITAGPMNTNDDEKIKVKNLIAEFANFPVSILICGLNKEGKIDSIKFDDYREIANSQKNNPTNKYNRDILIF